MNTMFENVQFKFMSLSTLLNGLDLDRDLVKADVIAKLNDAFSETYILLNQGFCENVSMCEKCTSNRDQLGALTQMIDECENTKVVSNEVCNALREFKDNIPTILNKMESVYLENMKDLQDA